jgi:hypothetical protein
MKIAAVCMTHRPDCSKTIRSVAGQVDVVLCIGTHTEPHDWTREREAAGDAEFVTLTWEPLKLPGHRMMAPRRNACLDEAAKLGCDWAVLIDSDEWIDWNGLDLRGQLEQGEVTMLQMWDAGQTHCKPRVFKLPRVGAFDEVIHEEFKSTGVASFVPLATFSETPKSPAEMAVLCDQIMTVCREELAKDPKSARYHYFLADCATKEGATKDLELAAKHFCLAGDYSEWDEFAAWSYCRAAICLVVMGRPGPAVQVGLVGLSRSAGVGELYWIIGCACVDLGRWEQAIFWAQNGIAHSRYCGIGAQYQRACACTLQGLWEGPFEVMALALEKIGNAEGAAASKTQADQARRMRIALVTPPEERAEALPVELLPMGEAPVELTLKSA